MKQTRGNTLVATMVTLVIILILAVVLFKGTNIFGSTFQKPAATRADKKGTTVLGAARWKAFDAKCQSDLGQVRLGIQVYQQSNDDHFPASIDELRLGSEFNHCPIPPHEAYEYNPETGQVSCPHPGHEKY